MKNDSIKNSNTSKNEILSITNKFNTSNSNNHSQDKSSNEEANKKINTDNQNDLNDDLSDSQLIQLDKDEIIRIKNKKIDELTNYIDLLVTQNEDLREKYANSISFFKHYIDVIESDKDTSIQDRSKLHLSKGEFVKCDFCDDIMLTSELKSHINELTTLSEIEYKIKYNDNRGLALSIQHGFNPTTIVEKTTCTSKLLF